MPALHGQNMRQRFYDAQALHIQKAFHYRGNVAGIADRYHHRQVFSFIAQLPGNLIGIGFLAQNTNADF